MFRAIAILLLLSSCTIERLFPREVANGVARLSVFNVGTLLVALNHNNTYAANASVPEECDFRSLHLTQTSTLHNDNLGLGRVVRAFTQCVFDFGDQGILIETTNSCGTKSSVRLFGRVRLSGTRTIHGILTGDTRMPVIPSGDRGVTLNISSLFFENYRVESSGFDKAMTIASGSASFDAEIHLAQSRDRGLCEIPLPNPTLSNLRFSSAPHASETIVELDGPLGRFQAAIDGTALKAQVGLYNNVHNHISGAVTLWGETYDVPVDDAQLSPNITQESYFEDLKCTENLNFPPQDSCHYEKDMASGVARLTVRSLGHLIAAIADPARSHSRPECNLGVFNQTPSKVTRISQTQAELVWEFRDCYYDFGQSANALSGRVRLSGTRRLKGFYLEGNSPYPVVPGSDGVSFVFSKVDLDNFAIETPAPKLVMQRGSLSFEVQIHLAKSKSLNVCSVLLPNLSLRDIHYAEGTTLAIHTDAAQVSLSVQGSDLHAQIFRDKLLENRVDGALLFLGKWVTIEGSQGVLDTNYKPSDFDAWMANQADLLQPMSSDCDSFEPIERKLADAIARLSVHSLATMLQNITAQTHPKQECNLGSNAVTSKTHIDKSNHLVTWSFDDCNFSLGEGYVTVSGTKSIAGFLTGDAKNPVVPGSGAVVTFHFTNAVFQNYNAHYSSTTHLTLGNAQLSFEVRVPLGVNSLTKLCTVVLPNPTFRHIRFASESPSRVMLTSSDISINGLSTQISGSDINAQVRYGSSRELDNTLDGYIRLFERDYLIPSDKLGLSPGTLLEDLDREGLRRCESFDRVRALNIARLLVLNVGSITQEAHDEYLKGDVREKGAWLPTRWKPNCGFSSHKTRAFPSHVVRSSTNESELHFRIDKCAVVDQALSAAYPDDCLGEKTVFEGQAIVSGTQIVQGRLKSFWAIFDDIMPKHPQATRFELDNIHLRDFSSYYLAAGAQRPDAKLTIHSGELSAVVKPVLAPKKGAPCEFLRSTPVVGFEINTKKPLLATILLAAQELEYVSPISIESAHLRAHNGVYQGAGNLISGDITVDGQFFYFDKELLNPLYNQLRFDQSYECRERFPSSNDYAIEHIIPSKEGWKPNCSN